jgi:hypothetical protein
MTTYEGGESTVRDPRAELFLRVTTGFAGQDQYYENAHAADSRAADLARQLAVRDWAWTAPFLAWLRSEGNIRTMSWMLAAEAVHERLGSQMHGGNRQLIRDVLQRPDEPGKLLGYWIRNWGRSLPQPVKRGTADALTRMLNQKQALRWDKTSDPVRLGDVIELCHPKPVQGTAYTAVQGNLFGHLITIRHNRDGYEPDISLGAVRKRSELNAMTPQERHDLAFKALDGKPELQDFTTAMASSWEWAKSWLGEL